MQFYNRFVRRQKKKDLGQARSHMMRDVSSITGIFKTVFEGDSRIST